MGMMRMLIVGLFKPLEGKGKPTFTEDYKTTLDDVRDLENKNPIFMGQKMQYCWYAVKSVE